MTPVSILFETPEAGHGGEDANAPDFFADLNLDQVFEAVVLNRDEYRLADFFRRPLSTVSEIRYRQDVFRDLASGLLRHVEGFAAEMRRVRSHLTAASERDHRYGKAAWFLDAGNIYSQAALALEAALACSEIRSEGLRRCAAYFGDYVHSQPFREMLETTRRLKEGLADVSYNVRVAASRVIVTEHRGERDYSAEVLGTFKKFRQGDAESRLIKYAPEFGSHLQDRIVDMVARLHPALFRSLLAYQDRFGDFIDAVVAGFDREVQFYVGYLALMSKLEGAGLAFCYPAVSADSKEILASETFDLALAIKVVADRGRVVTNGFELEGAERIIVVSGPNQGGKTTFARTFGQLHFLAALGCPVPGTSARLFLCDRIFSHFERREQLEDLHGKLQDELLRVRAILQVATDRSVVVMNESLASTTAEDALFLGQEVIGRLLDLGALGVYVTFIDELSRLGPSVISMVSGVVPENPAERTFKIVRRPADGRAYARAIAEKHGLTYQAIKERMRR